MEPFAGKPSNMTLREGTGGDEGPVQEGYNRGIMSKQPKTKYSLTDAQIRHQLSKMNVALAHVEAEREILLGLRNSFEKLLQLRPPIAQEHDAGVPSARSSVLRVLVEAQGQPLHAEEILIRILALGAVLGTARSSTEDRVRWVNLLAYSHMKGHHVEKVGRRTWRWNDKTDRKQDVDVCE